MANNIDYEKEYGFAVLKWAKKLSATASVSLLLACLFHDIDRIVNKGTK